MLPVPWPTSFILLLFPFLPCPSPLTVRALVFGPPLVLAIAGVQELLLSPLIFDGVPQGIWWSFSMIFFMFLYYFDFRWEITGPRGQRQY